MKLLLRREKGLRRWSPPSRGAWIEIPVNICQSCFHIVAPLAGGVD